MCILTRFVSYLLQVREAKRLRVTEVSEKEERRPRPHGLNTVELLKVASSSLGIGPAAAMSIAERLYISVRVRGFSTASVCTCARFGSWSAVQLLGVC